MSFATETLALAQAAYQKALAGQTVEFGGRRFTSHDIGALLSQVKHWQAEVDKEAAKAAGTGKRSPIRFYL
ncbi:hypothetical protein [Methylomonas rapida]|uniref:GpW protein n=1 Tax=Methylomonas rapida TaxID=2963939 RepID=A0ABY7GG15_9GAMM|nr:hypothetical protein [Methylomonas rapida]WAR42923.1 hypothetical protein NM686_010965 [Methylomonas rapida]